MFSNSRSLSCTSESSPAQRAVDEVRWLNLLQQLDGSVLWLVSDHRSVEGDLRVEPAQCVIELERLVFAKRVADPEYLARISLADLFLDTFPLKTGTTASDAL